MRNLYLIILSVSIMMLGFYESVNAQVTNYSFAQSSTTYTPISGTAAGATGDDALSGILPIGFTFTYCGTNYTSFKVSTNGWFNPGGALTSYDLSNNLTGSTSKPVLAPLWDDLATQSLTYLTTGTSPDQVLTVQWSNVYWNYGNSSFGGNFQLKIYQTTNTIQFIYGGISGTPSSASASIGINDPTGGSGHFISVTPASPTATYSTTSENSAIAAWPGNGIMYTFSLPPMVYSSCTTTQNTLPIGIGEQNAQIIGLQVVTTGWTNPLSVTSIDFNTNGTSFTSDLLNARVYYTGNSSTFATTTQFGSTQASPGAPFTVTGTATLNNGINYFWLAYDVAPTAPLGDLIDAECTSVTVAGTPHVPTITAPAGNRVVTGISYTSCTTTQTSANAIVGTFATNVIGVQLVTTGANAAGFNATSFTFNTNGTTSTADITALHLYYTGTSSTFNATAQFGPTIFNPNGTITLTGTQGLQAGTNYFWLAYDVQGAATPGDFLDAECTSLTGANVVHTPTVTAPAGYLTIVPLIYCTCSATSGSSGEEITGFTLGSFTNTSPATGSMYHDYTALGGPILIPGITYPISVTSYYNPGSTYTYTDHLSVYIDYNHNGVFTDPGELVYDIGTNSNNTVSGNITVPSGTLPVGQTRCRVVLAEQSTAPPCGTYTWGETEDYTVNIIAPGPMIYSTCYASQPITTAVVQNSTNNGILLVNVVTSGNLNPIHLTGLTFTTNGSTNPSQDISVANVYYTGSSNNISSISPTNLIATFTPPDPTFYAIPLSPGTTLSPGNNYFWLTYDVPISSQPGDFIDAEFLAATVADSIRIPTVTTPAGNRLILSSMCGNYTLNPGLPSSSTNFTSFSNALAALTVAGVSCPVIINVAAGTYTEQLSVTAVIPGASAINTVTFQAASGDSSSVIIQTVNTSSINYVFQMNGASYLIWKKLTFQVTDPTNSYGTVIRVIGTTHDIQFQHCRFIGLIVPSSQSTNLSVVYKYNVTNNNIIFNGCRFDNGAFGAYWYGYSSTPYETGTLFSNNIFNNQTYMGLYLYYLDGCIVSGNTFTTGTTTNTGTYIGIYEYYLQNGSDIAGNTIIISSNVNSSAGIERMYCNNISTSTARVYNNFISCASTLPNEAIYAYYSPYSIYDYNTINMITPSTTTYSIYVLNTAGTVDIRNNIFANPGGGYAIYSSSHTGVTSDYNDFYTSGTTLGYWTSATATLANWQTQTGQDAHSISLYPIFLSPTNLHTFDNAVNNLGTPIAGITTDIDGETRSTTTPDLGADEFTPMPMVYVSSTATQNVTSAVATGWNNTQILGLQVVTNGTLNPLSATSFSFTTNGSTNAATDLVNASVYYTGTNSTFSTANLFGTLSAGLNGTFTITGTQALQYSTNYFWLTYSISTGATIGDVVDGTFESVTVAGTAYTPTVTNPAGSRAIIAAMCGTFTINPSLPAGGTNYQSFQAAIADLQVAGIGCPVVFNVASGTYSGNITIPNITNTSAVNTITFQSAALDTAAVILTYTPSGVSDADNFTVWLNGAGYIIFQYMTIKSGGTSNYANVIVLNGGANHNSFLHNHLMGGTVNYSTVSEYYTAIVYSSKGMTSINPYNVYRYNTFEGGYCGIIAYNVPAYPNNPGLEITNNKFLGQGRLVTNLRYQSHPVITGNTVVMTTVSNYNGENFGFHMYYCSNGYVITGNNVSISNAANTEYGTNIQYCGASASSPALIANNFFSLNSQALTNNNFGIYALGTDSTKYLHVLYNSVNIYGGANASSRAFTLANSTAVGIVVKNNIFSNVAGGYASYIDNVTTGWSMNNNDYYTTGSNIGYWGSAYPTLAAWQTATGQDAASLNVNPFFVSNTNLHTFNGILNALATPMAEVTTDIDGDARDPLTPDIGADEFVPSPHDAYLMAMINPIAGCGLNQETVTIKIKNTGSATIYPGDMTASYVIGTGTPVTETVNDTILPNQIFNYSFTTLANLLAPTTNLYFNLTCYVNLTGDIQQANDTVHYNNFLSGYTPVAPIVIGATVPYNSTATLHATQVNPTDHVNWYSDPLATNLIATNVNTYTTPILYGTHTYYVRSVAPGVNLNYTFDNDLQNWTTSAPCVSGYNWSWNSDGGNGAAFASDPATNSSQVLTSPAISVGGFTSIGLSFIHKYYTESNYDGGTVWYQLDNGPWQKFTPTVNSYNLSYTIYNNAFNNCVANTDTKFSGNFLTYVTSSGTIDVTGATTLHIAFQMTSDPSVYCQYFNRLRKSYYTCDCSYNRRTCMRRRYSRYYFTCYCHPA
ncbi:MAG: GEVED domain-containing protein [Bacteroidia bacterium]|nr:GEVED domain-containing protein [Bacteroidia bacterium]